MRHLAQRWPSLVTGTMLGSAGFQVDGGVVFEYEMKIYFAPVHPG